MVTWTLEEFQQLLARAAEQELPNQLRIAMTRSALTAERASKQQASKDPRARTGRLRSSITGFSRGDGLESEAVVRADTPYARLQEEGGTVRPTRGQYLAIPLGPAKTAAGVARGGPREFPDLFLFRSQRGNLLLGRRDGSRIQPYFLLKKQVTLKARPYLAPGIQAAREGLPKLLEQAVRRALGE